MGFLRRAEKELIYRKNLKLFEKKLPPVAEAIKRVKAPIKVKEINGKLDGFIGDISLYGGDARSVVNKQIEVFAKAQPKIFNSASISDVHERDEIIAYRYLRKLLEVTGDRFTAPELSEDSLLPLLIVVGVGFGMHLEELLHKYKVQNLILIDVPIYFKLSLYWLNWEWIFEYFSPENKRQLHIVLLDNKYAEKHPDDAYQPILSAIQGMNPATAFYSYYFQHLTYEPPLDPIGWLRKHPIFRQLFYGYFDDELWSLDWTIEKIRRNIPLYYGDRKVPHGSVAFVLGAGPSLDKTLHLVENFKDRAVVISCGSTITSLEKAGIKPDIHVELERTKYTYDMLSEVNADFLREVFLVTTNAVWTDCFNLFEKGGFVLKGNDTGSTLLRHIGVPRLWEIGPTVTAMGVSLAESLGFREVYLFGVDLGSREPSIHHSKLSNYYNPKSMLSGVRPRFSKQVPGNFGGYVWTDSFFEETAYSIHKTIYRSGIRVYNLSDGVRIQDAIPLDPEDFTLEGDVRKDVTLKIIRENFRKEYSGILDVKKFLEELLLTFRNLERAVRLMPIPENRGEALFVMAKLEELLRALGVTGYTLLFHNTYQMSLSVVGHLLTLRDEETAEFMSFFLKLYADFVKEAGQAIGEVFQKHYSM